jgi:hypothetical protein
MRAWKTAKPTQFMLLFSICFITTFITSSFGSHALAIEKAKYTLIEREGNFELRQYEPHIVAETVVSGSFSDVGNEGFRRLFDYISGQNRAKASIAMTAPVNQQPSSQKIGMTAPVNQEREGADWRITFLMPSEYTMDTLPEPLDPEIRLVQRPGRLMAAYRYSGTWDRSRYEDRETRLRALIHSHGLTPVGDPIFARYDPPFMPWFLRRNEVLIPVERAQP